jgi:hypothetical protein
MREEKGGKKVLNNAINQKEILLVYFPQIKIFIDSKKFHPRMFLRSTAPMTLLIPLRRIGDRKLFENRYQKLIQNQYFCILATHTLTLRVHRDKLLKSSFSPHPYERPAFFSNKHHCEKKY